MRVKTLDWTKVESPLPIRQIDKNEIKITPLDKAMSNSAPVVAPRLNVQPIPSRGTFSGE